MAKKTIFFDGCCGFNTSATVENGKITSFNFENTDNSSLIGNIYKGRIETVLSGMQAAFVNCGLERNCYLSADDAYPDRAKYDGENGDTALPLSLKEGDEIMVQVVKAPVGNKGARVTAFPSFVGKELIYLPRTPFVGVSRKITDEELRKNLIYSAGKMKRQDEGLIFRTAAPYAKRSDLEIELSYLRNLFAEISGAFEKAQTGALLYSDVELPRRVMRDTLHYEIEKIIVGNKQLEKLINELMNLYPPENRKPVILHNSGRDMLDEYGFFGQICEIVSPRVKLDNGAYLVIEKTEALTVIDVNTGKFTGADSLEQTVYYTNILAAREIARQVKLRNIGGIVVVDFIDMTDPAHRKALVEELETALKNDSAKCAVSSMSEFGLVEFTRKRSGASPLSILTKPCGHCKYGYVKSPKFTAIGIRAKLLGLFSDGNELLRVDMNSAVMSEICVWQEFTQDLKDRLKGAEVFFVPHKTYADEQVNYRISVSALPLPDSAVKIV